MEAASRGNLCERIADSGADRTAAEDDQHNIKMDIGELARRRSGRARAGRAICGWGLRAIIAFPETAESC